MNTKLNKWISINIHCTGSIVNRGESPSGLHVHPQVGFNCLSITLWISSGVIASYKMGTETLM